MPTQKMFQEAALFIYPERMQKKRMLTPPRNSKLHFAIHTSTLLRTEETRRPWQRVWEFLQLSIKVKAEIVKNGNQLLLQEGSHE